MADSLVVAPNNMGSSFVYNEKKKRYELNVGKGLSLGSDGLVNLKLAKRSGNLLSLDEDGLYYGIEAPADTRNLRVDPENGNDNNDGTVDKPLATIKEVFKRNAVGTKFTVWLDENKTHEWRSSWGDMSGKFAYIRPSGTAADYAAKNNIAGSIHFFRSQQLKRPTLKFIADATVQSGSATKSKATLCYNSGGYSQYLEFYGINIDATNVNTSLDTYAYNLGWFGVPKSAVNLSFVGCDIQCGHHPIIHSGGDSKIILDNTWISESGRFLYLHGNGTIGIWHSAGGTEGTLINPSNVLTWHRHTPSTSIGSRIENVLGVQKANVFTNVNLGI